MIVEAFPRPARLIDARHLAASVHHGQRKRRRPIEDVTGFCLHQAAVFATETAERWKNGGCHFVVFTTGVTLQLHDIDWEVAHGNGWNTATVGIEFNGRFLGDLSNPRTLWDDPSTAKRETPMVLTRVQAEAGKELIRWIYTDGLKRGARWRALVAHRQASASRPNDPGQEIWQDVAVPLHAELGLSDGGVGFTIGDGLPIPEVWDARCKGIPY